MHPFSTSWKRQKTVSFQGGKKGCIGNEWVTKNPSHRKYRNNVPTEVSQSWNIPWARMNRMSLCENLVLSFSKPQPVLFITQYRFCFWVLLQQKHAKIFIFFCFFLRYLRRTGWWWLKWGPFLLRLVTKYFQKYCQFPGQHFKQLWDKVFKRGLSKFCGRQLLLPSPLFSHLFRPLSP